MIGPKMNFVRQLIEQRTCLEASVPQVLLNFAKAHKGGFETTNLKGGTLTYWFSFYEKKDAQDFIDLVMKYGEEWNPSDEPTYDVNGNWRVSVI